MLKNILLLLFCFLALHGAYAQDDITLCHATATEKFAMFASNKTFNTEHAIPGKYIHVSEEGGKMITFPCADGKVANAYFIPAKTKSKHWVFVFQEWWGLNDYVKRQSEIFFKDLGNVNVLALDMYDGNLATDRENAARYMQEFKQERGDQIVKGAMTYAGKDAEISTVGWCFGGGQSLQAAIQLGQQAEACVIYYGMPVEDLNKLKLLKTDVLGIFASRDQYITPAVVSKFETNMKSAQKKVTIKNYDADHGFANPSNQKGFNDVAAQDAYKHALAFLKERIK